jgi:peptidoglycan/LPS O-acetylase OafA/YrhL
VRYSPQLDGLRGIAISAVLAQHLFETHFRGAWVGVDIFFVLSGFLITSILINEQQSTGRISFKNFYGRRALRLVPALLVGIALTGLLTAFGLTPFKSADAFGHAAIPALFYFANFTNHETMGTLVHTWSLSVEEQFYLLWPIVLTFIVLRLHPAKRIAIILLLIAAFAGTRFYFESQNVSWWNLYRWFHTRADELMAGALVACATAAWPQQIASAIRKLKLPTYAAIAFVAYIFITAKSDQRWLYQWGFTVIAGCCALIVFTSQFDTNGLLARVLQTKPLVWLGKRSYGVYVYHVPVIWVIAHHIHFPGGKDGMILALLTKVAATLALSWASYRWIETPALALKDKLFAAKPSARLATQDLVLRA